MSIIEQSKSTVGEPAGVAVAPKGLQAGYDGSEGKGVFYPPTANKGRLIVDPADNIGDYDVSIVNAAFNQASVVTIPDPSNAAASFVLNTGVAQMQASSGVRLDKDSETASAGAVTINAQSGIITSEALTTAAGASATITLNNSFVLTSSIPMVSLIGGTNTTLGLQVSAVVASAGVVTITISNSDALAALNGTVILGFLIV